MLVEAKLHGGWKARIEFRGFDVDSPWEVERPAPSAAATAGFGSTKIALKPGVVAADVSDDELRMFLTTWLVVRIQECSRLDERDSGPDRR